MNQIGNFYIKQVLTVVLKQDVAKAGKGWGVGGNSIPAPPPPPVPNLVSLTLSSLQILGKTQAGVFPISGFLVNPLLKKIDITPELLMILTWILDQ